MGKQIAKKIAEEVLQNIWEGTGVPVFVLRFKDNGSHYYRKLTEHDIPQKFIDAGLPVSEILPMLAKAGVF